MKQLLIFLFFSVFVGIPLFAAAAPRDGYLDIEDDQIISVFSAPGYDWKTCPLDPKKCQASGWLDNEAKIKVISAKPKKIKIVDPETSEATDVEFHEIQYEYEREAYGTVYKKKGTGWIDDASLRFNKPPETFFGVKKTKGKTEAKKPCPPENSAAKNNKDLKDVGKALEDLTVAQTADLVAPYVGMCAVSGKNSAKAVAALKSNANPYDELVLPKINAQAMPKILSEGKQLMTRSQLVDIDAIARTLYGEQGGCFSHGLQYPFAVTKVVANRSKDSKTAAQYITGKHDPSKSDVAKVTTSASQFNVWMKNHGKDPNPTLKQALCPPSDETKKFYRGQNPPKMETDIWKNAVRIATQAVLFPVKFNEATKGVEGIYNYTSGMSSFYVMKQVERSIEKRPVSYDKCVQLWK